jgi:hypothetical protein
MFQVSGVRGTVPVGPLGHVTKVAAPLDDLYSVSCEVYEANLRSGVPDLFDARLCSSPTGCI